MHNPKVLITFTTIEQLQNVYCLGGDAVIYDILEYIKGKESVEITSASIEGVLYNRKTYRPEFQDFYDSLNLAAQTSTAFVTAYHLPLGFQDGKPIILPAGFKTIKVVNSEIQIYTEQNEIT